MDEFEPRNEAEIVEVVRAALANETSLEVLGAGTRQNLGRPVEAGAVLTTRALSGVSMYEAEELVLTARPGTPMREITSLLDQQGQQLAFEPVDYHRFFDTTRASGTIGGCMAINASGSRRITVGAARDSLLGFRAVSGRGQVYKSGGRVIKNVTGYDLSKLLCGSFGTLGVLSEVTVKVMPKPETEQTLAIAGLDDRQAVEVMCAAAGLPLEVSALAHVPDVTSLNKALNEADALAFRSGSVTLLRLEGPEISVRSRLRDLIERFKSSGGEMLSIDQNSSYALWQGITDGAPLAGLPDFANAVIWRISTAPSQGAQLVELIRAAGVSLAGYYYDWAGGLIWLAVEAGAPTPKGDAFAKIIRSEVDKFGGHATLIRADCQLRRHIPVFHPQSPALAALSARVKESFDPEHILNPGRLVARV